MTTTLPNYGNTTYSAAEHDADNAPKKRRRMGCRVVSAESGICSFGKGPARGTPPHLVPKITRTAECFMALDRNLTPLRAAELAISKVYTAEHYEPTGHAPLFPERAIAEKLSAVKTVSQQPQTPRFNAAA